MVRPELSQRQDWERLTLVDVCYDVSRRISGGVEGIEVSSYKPQLVPLDQL